MHNQPSVPELLIAVRNFIEHSAAPQLTGHAAFHARVALNTLDTALRDLEARPQNEAAEAAGLRALLDVSDPDTPLSDLVSQLCDQISDGRAGIETPGLLDHLKTTAIAQLKVDQPKYSGLQEALKGT